MTDVERIEVLLSVQQSLLRHTLASTAKLSLSLVYLLTIEAHPDAVALIVNETDQDSSGSLRVGSWINPDGVIRELDDDASDALFEPLATLDDLSKSTWGSYTTSFGLGGSHLRLDLLAVKAHLPTLMEG